MHALEVTSVWLKNILKHNADVYARDDQSNTPLHVAALCGKDEVALALIKEFNCNTSVKGSFGRSLLHNACAGGNVSLVETLIPKHKADVDARDDQSNTPLHVAAFSGFDTGVQLRHICQRCLWSMITSQCMRWR